jgi:hypothetical protein
MNYVFVNINQPRSAIHALGSARREGEKRGGLSKMTQHAEIPVITIEEISVLRALHKNTFASAILARMNLLKIEQDAEIPSALDSSLHQTTRLILLERQARNIRSHSKRHHV